MKKPLLCRLRLHRWQFQVPTVLGTGCVETCTRCGRRRFWSLLGACYYEGEDK
jgi:hypothetical protein